MATSTDSASYTYTNVDIEKVVRRFAADIVMIAQSSGAIQESEAKEYVADVETLAKMGYLTSVDITLFSNGTEVRAVTYTVNAAAGDLTSSRPGGVLWPKVYYPQLRIVLWYTNSYDAAARQAMGPKLKHGWWPSQADTSHSSLTQTTGRAYASNGWGLQRKDYGA
jgi:hypothetical protein